MRGAISAALALALGLAAVPARADGSRCGPVPPITEPTEEARAVYESAKEHARHDRYDEALAAYQRAYDLSPSYVILFNIGKAAELTGDAARAIVAYECHLEHGGADVDATRQAEVTAAVRALEKKVGLIALQIDEPGARVTIDGTPVGVSPIQALLPVNPGKRLVQVQGSRAESRAIEVVAAERLALEFTLAKPVAPERPPPFRFPSGVVGAAWILTGLLGASTAVTGTLAIIGAKDIEGEVYLGPARMPPPGSGLEEKIERTEALSVAADALLTALLITGSAAITFSVVNAVNTPAEATPPVKVGVGPGGVVLQVGPF